MESEMLKGFIDLIILLIINNKDTYGYEINKIIKNTSEDMYSIGEGTLYVALKRLECSNCIKSFYLDTEIKTRRKYYSITDHGKEELNKKLDDFYNLNKLINMFQEGNDE